jgi:hypothetical protein
MLVEHLAALTPRAVQALAGLLSDKSGYVRLKAAKDILNRSSVGGGREPVPGAPLLIRINLGCDAPADATQSQSLEIAPQRREPPPVSVSNASDITDLDLDCPELSTVLTSNESSIEQKIPSDINILGLDENASQLAEKQLGGQKSRNGRMGGSLPHDSFPKVRAEDATEELAFTGEGKDEAGSRFDDLEL